MSEQRRIEELKKAANAIGFACSEPAVADDVARILREAATEIERLRAELAELRAKASAAGAVGDFPHEEMDAIALARFRVEPTDSNIWGWCVRAGDGKQELYKGRKSDCDSVSRKLTGAFLDGAWLANEKLNAAPPAQAVSVPVAVVHDGIYTHEDGVVKQTVRVLLNPLPEGAELYWGQPAQAVSVPFDIEEYLSAYEWRAEDGGLSELTTRDRQLLQDFANGLPLYTALPAQAVSVPAGVNPFASIWDDCELRKPAMWGCLNQVFTTEEAAKEYQLSKFRGGTGPSVIAFDIAPLATFMIINTSEGMKVNFYGVGNFQEPNHTVITDRGFLNRLGVPFDTGSSQIKQVDYAAVLGALHDELSRVASLHALFDAELQSVESYKHEQTARVERIIKIIRLKLTSGNDVQVSRIHLDRDEAELVISMLAAAPSPEQLK